MFCSVAAKVAARHHSSACHNIDHNQTPLLSNISFTLYPIANSMNYVASALAAVRSQSAKPLESLQSTHQILIDHTIQEACSLHEATSPEDCGSISDKGSSRRSKRNSTFARSKTTLQFCRPPPIQKKKRALHIRPKVLLQLRRSSQASRPTPAFDVFSPEAFAPRLAKKFPNTFHGKASLGVDDLVVVESEDYSSTNAETDGGDDVIEKDNWNSREIVAFISQHSKGQASRMAEIYLSGGKTWTGSSLPKGGYEFGTVADHGLRTVARWVPRKGSRRQTFSSHAGQFVEQPAEQKAFNFSLIDPCSRRHAIIAMLDAHSMEISDRYLIPSGDATVQPSPTGLTSPSVVDDRDFAEVDEELKALIVVTGVWVACCEGFSPNVSPDHFTAKVTKAMSTTPTHKRRSLSLGMKDFRKHSAAPGSDTTSRRPSSVKQAVSSLTEPTSTANTPFLSPPFLTPPRRTQSTGTTVMQRIRSPRASAKEASDDDSLAALQGWPSTKKGKEGSSSAREKSSKKIPAPKAETKKRPKGIKGLCCSFKAGSNDTSP